MLDLAIVGGGPGGLMSAWYLKKKLGELCRITIFEATDRLGGDAFPARAPEDENRGGGHQSDRCRQNHVDEYRRHA